MPTSEKFTPDRERKTVLTVEDDRDLLATLEYNLLAAGYDVLTAQDGASSLRLARDADPDLIILDLNLPVMDGLDVCRALRNDGDDVPILVLTARHGVDPCVESLENGADDYVSKPFQVAELVARVNSHLRRADYQRHDAAEAAEASATKLEVGNLRVDFVKRKATKAGEPIDLRPREFDILRCLASKRGRTVSRAQMLSEVWDDAFRGGNRLVDVHVSMLRGKIEDDRKHPRLITTVHGVGYRLAQ